MIKNERVGVSKTLTVIVLTTNHADQLDATFVDQCSYAMFVGEKGREKRERKRREKREREEEKREERREERRRKEREDRKRDSKRENEEN